MTKIKKVTIELTDKRKIVVDPKTAVLSIMTGMHSDHSHIPEGKDKELYNEDLKTKRKYWNEVRAMKADGHSLEEIDAVPYPRDKPTWNTVEQMNATTLHGVKPFPLADALLIGREFTNGFLNDAFESGLF